MLGSQWVDMTKSPDHQMPNHTMISRYFTPARRWLLAAIVGWMTSIGGAPALAQPLHLRQEVVDVVGVVTLTAGDGAQFSGAGARLVMRCRSESRARVEIADGEGAYRFGGVPAVGCVVSTELQGFGSQTKRVRAGDAADLHFHLDVKPLAAAVTARGTATPAALPAPAAPRAPATACPRAGQVERLSGVAHDRAADTIVKSGCRERPVVKKGAQ
jgi:hypothetical protein